MPRRRRKRGYPKAILIGLEMNQAVTWNIYSESVKTGERMQGDNEYNFFESIVDVLRQKVKQGIKSVLIAAPDEKDYRNFMYHIRKHQSWLLNGWSLNIVTFKRIEEPAMTANQVRSLVKAHGFKEKLTETNHEDLLQVMSALEKRLSSPEGIETVLFTLKEIEDAVYSDEMKPEYILVTEPFRSRKRRRTQRLRQVAANKNIKTRIIKPDTPAGARITQFGGIICILRE
jgi:stalled ribosome rescue protein Dom34